MTISTNKFVLCKTSEEWNEWWGGSPTASLLQGKNLKEIYSDWEFLNAIRPEKTIESAVANKNRYGQSMSRTKVWTKYKQQ